MGMLAALIRAGFGVKGKDNDPDKLIGLAGVIAKEQRAEAAAHAEAATREDAARFTLPDAAAEVRALPPEATGAQGDRGDDASGLG